MNPPEIGDTCLVNDDWRPVIGEKSQRDGPSLVTRAYFKTARKTIMKQAI